MRALVVRWPGVIRQAHVANILALDWLPTFVESPAARSATA
jgi:hypothetical protein